MEHTAANGLSRANRNALRKVWETEQALRKQGQHMLVCVSGYYYLCIKPGGTAGSNLSCPSSVYCCWDFFI